MGAEYSCQTVESEEETVNIIFKEMFKKEVKIGSLYDNFLKCIVYYPSRKKLKISKKLFLKFLDYVLEENRYQELYKEYFFSIISKYSEIDSIKKIGLILIEKGIGNEYPKLKSKIYTKHFKNFYLENSTDIINKQNSHSDIIFPTGNDSSFYSVLDDQNKDPNCDKFNFNLKKNHSNEIERNRIFNFQENNKYTLEYKKVYSDEIKKNTLSKISNKDDLTYLNSYFNYDFGSSTLNFNETQNPNFISFFKKKELECLDNQIKNLITDIIDNNTECLIYPLKDILSTKRLDTLVESWDKNNKKLLIFDIHRTYISLVEKLCLFPNLNFSENNMISNCQNNNNPNDSSYEFINTRNSIKSNLNGIRKRKDSLFIEKDNDDDNNKSKIKVQRELEDFIITKEKLIGNFFDLTEPQINGDFIRNWLYENSKN